MKQKIFAVMGATGHIGRVIVEDLLKRGHKVRAIAHKSTKLHSLELKGAESIALDFDDATALTDAFKDCYAVFTLLPPIQTTDKENFGNWQDRVSESICTAISNSGCTHVVNLSSIGGNLADGTGPIKGLYRHEKRLDRINTLQSLVHLRPNFFMDNLEGFLPMIKSQGVIRSTLRQDLPIAMVATRDIGWKAADFLDSSAPLGRLIFEFVGPKEVTMQYVTEVLGKALDQPTLSYNQISYEDAKKEMLSSGMKADVVELMLEMYEGYNAGHIVPTQELKPSHHGTTSIEEYCQMLAHKLFATTR